MLHEPQDNIGIQCIALEKPTTELFIQESMQ